MNYANLPSDSTIANKVVDAQATTEATKLERGWVGAVFGGRASVPYNVAALIAVGTFVAIVAVVCFVSDSSGWPRKDIATLLGSFLTLTLGYLFGKGAKS